MSAHTHDTTVGAQDDDRTTDSWRAPSDGLGKFLYEAPPVEIERVARWWVRAVEEGVTRHPPDRFDERRGGGR